MNQLLCTAVATLALLSAIPGTATAQSTTAQGEPASTSDPQSPTTDVFDLWRKFRHQEPPPGAVWDYRKPMKAFAPVIGAKPSSGAVIGVAGNVAFYRGDPSTTHISSVVTSLTFSTKGQTALTDRFTMFGRGDRWRLDGDHRFQWTSLETYDLGTSADTRTGIRADFDFFRLHHTAYYRLRPGLFAGAGLYFDNHINVGPSEEGDADWATSPYVQYSEDHDLPLDAQASSGPSLDLLWDTRDNFINANRGFFAKAGYRTSFEGFLGSDSSWQRVNLEVRTYRKLSRDGRHKLSGWLYSELIVGGAAPYLDLPGTGLDTYGRSARGYSEGQFRGEKLAYAEIEYRGTLMHNGLLGMVAFMNVTTVTDLRAGEHLFDSFAPAGGAGLRVLINKRSQTNLCIDLGFGKQGSRGVYLAIQEAF